MIAVSLHTRRAIFTLAFCLLPFAFCLPPAASARNCFPLRPVAIDHWRGEYFNNPNLQGAPILIRDDGTGTLDFAWGLESPGRECDVPADHFSARWTRTVTLAGGAYQFTLSSDDGARLLIDGQERFAAWSDHPLATNSVDVTLAPGNHRIVVEYYERWGSATISLNWRQHPCSATVAADHWRAEFFTSASLDGAPALVRDEGEGRLNFEWSADATAMACGIKSSAPVARFSRRAAFGAGPRRFALTGHGGARVLIDGQMRVDRWGNEGLLDAYFDAAPGAGNHQVVIEYRAGAARPALNFVWQPLPCTEEVPAANWRGEYFNSDDLSGTPTVVRDDGRATLDFNWSDRSPAPDCGLRAEAFSARWTRTALFAAGVYRFVFSGAGGVKVWVDDQARFEQWRAAAFHSSFELELSAGQHKIVIEYAALANRAALKFAWVDPPCVALAVPTDHWRAEYFSNQTLRGQPAIVRDEGTGALDFAGAVTKPRADCLALKDQFSVRWARTAVFAAAVYRFRFTADDGARLLIDGRLVSDQWRDQPESDFDVDVELTAGPHRIVVEYYQNFGAAVARLSWAVAPCSAIVAADHWRGDYFNNLTLRGRPTLTRDDGDGALNFETGGREVTASCGIGRHDFSVRWTRTMALPEGVYRFKLTADDGARVYVDQQLKFDQWIDQVTTHEFDVPLAAGNHTITFEYFQHWGNAVAQLSWARNPCFAQVAPERWRGEYFNNPTLAGTPTMTRDDGDGSLNFAWGVGSPAAACGVNADDFSARWTRRLFLEAGIYRFTATADDGVRLWVNGRKLIDQWRNQSATTFSVAVPLATGAHRIVVEYYDHTANATAQLNWQKLAMAR